LAGNIVQVQNVLSEIEADKVPQILIFNKIDRVKDLVPHVEKDEHGKPSKVWVSARSGAGLDGLVEAIANALYGDPLQRSVLLTPQEGKLRAELYQVAAVLSERVDEEGNWIISVRIGRDDFERLLGGREEHS